MQARKWTEELKRFDRKSERWMKDQKMKENSKDECKIEKWSKKDDKVQDEPDDEKRCKIMKIWTWSTLHKHYKKSTSMKFTKQKEMEDGSLDKKVKILSEKQENGLKARLENIWQEWKNERKIKKRNIKKCSKDQCW